MSKCKICGEYGLVYDTDDSILCMSCVNTEVITPMTKEDADFLNEAIADEKDKIKFT